MIAFQPKAESPTSADLERMHALYLKYGQERKKAPHVVYHESLCPNPNCGLKLQAVDFCLEHYGPSVHDPLVRAWWNDTGFAGRCPHCGGWIHFTVRAKSAVTAEQAAALPQLPDDWHKNAVIL